METKICKSCAKVKPLYAYYKVNRSGRQIYELDCIQCTSNKRKQTYEEKKDPSLIVEKMPITAYSHYLLTVVDDSFNEFTGTISARLHYDLKPEFLGLDSFKMDGKRMFYEAKFSKMSMNEYYIIHEKQRDPKNIRCPNLTISKSMSKKEVKGILHEFLTALYFFHNNC